MLFTQRVNKTRYATCTKGKISEQWWVELLEIAFGYFMKITLPDSASDYFSYSMLPETLAKNVFEQ